MFRLNRERTYKYPVVVTLYDADGNEQKGRFTATFRILPIRVMREDLADRALLDQVLMGVDGIEMPGEDGQPLSGQALLEALKDDPATATALAGAYVTSAIKKNQPRT